MKKLITMILALALVLTSVAAFADTGSNQSFPGGGAPQMGQMPGNNQNGGAPDFSNGQPPELPEGVEAPDTTNGQPPELPEGVEAPDTTNGQPPELPEGVEAPDTTNGQTNGMPGNNGPMGGKPGDMNGGNAPGMIDFDAMATNSVISSETLEKIKAFMEANKPEGQPEMNGEAPEQNCEAPDLTGEAPELGADLLDDLLKNEIITQAEYDALVAARTAAQTTEDTTK